ncbi:MAG: V8-like protein Glu-specific endopeptidase-like protein [Blastococcus sp.]|jgi:hypothetical protein|nr:V8-like protein Glu-specific endopeptidase-like protein [Blastococcus sp.]
MPGPALVLVHGRSQQMAPADRGNPAAEAAFVQRKKRGWLGGLAKGLTLAGLPAVDEADVYYPYYGNLFVDAIAAHEKAGLAGPELELATTTRPETADSLILDSAQLLGFAPDREPISENPADVAETARAWRAYTQGEEIDFGPILRNRLVRAALQYVARKTGASELVIEQFLADVAYYLDVEEIRRLVLDEVARAVRKAAGEHQQVVVIAHSLGSVVGYDLFDELAGEVDVPLFVTAGCPLGLPAVMRNVRPAHSVQAQRPGPQLRSTPVPWLNAYDVRDVVALVNPLGNFYTGGVRDERTFNAGAPHSIADYLSDPDVARPIGRVLTGQAPW